MRRCTRFRVHGPLLLAMLLACPTLAESVHGPLVVSLLDSRNSDAEVAAQLHQVGTDGGNWLAMLFEVFKESRKDVQENQAYWIERLEERDKINDAIQNYMQNLTEQAVQILSQVYSNQVLLQLPITQSRWYSRAVALLITWERLV